VSVLVPSAVLARLGLVVLLAWAVPWVIEAMRSLLGVPTSHAAVAATLGAVYVLIAAEDALKRLRHDATTREDSDDEVIVEPVGSRTGPSSYGDDEVIVEVIAFEPGPSSQL
jgi:hypothetical protein